MEERDACEAGGHHDDADGHGHLHLAADVLRPSTHVAGGEAANHEDCRLIAGVASGADEHREKVYDDRVLLQQLRVRGEDEGRDALKDLPGGRWC